MVRLAEILSTGPGKRLGGALPQPQEPVLVSVLPEGKLALEVDPGLVDGLVRDRTALSALFRELVKLLGVALYVEVFGIIELFGGEAGRLRSEALVASSLDHFVVLREVLHVLDVRHRAVVFGDVHLQLVDLVLHRRRRVLFGPAWRRDLELQQLRLFVLLVLLGQIFQELLILDVEDPVLADLLPFAGVEGAKRLVLFLG